MIEEKNFRKNVLDEIQGIENEERKEESYRETEIYSGRIDDYVKDYLCDTLGSETASKMPRISTINICKRIVNNNASLYKKAPKRTFVNATPELQEKLEIGYGLFENPFISSTT